MHTEISLFSDGGGEKLSSAAAACILEPIKADHDRSYNCFDFENLKTVVYLGQATNNESELLGGIIGFAILRHFRQLQQEAEGEVSALKVHWVSDSEYVLKSATSYILNWQRNGWRLANRSPVKNQGLWRAFLKSSEGIEIVAKHVRGHTGHYENELCDTACTWARNNTDFFQKPLAEATITGKQWWAVDGRPILEMLRTEHPVEDAYTELLALGAKLGRLADR